ncbi:MAG: glycosyltransferase family 2 protein [Candidatus Levyibacteriota bacterium]
MISIVVPVYNEEESLEAFYEVLVKELSKLKKPYEILFIDDGSTDATLRLLKAFHKKDKDVKIFSFRKNVGKSEALSVGFSQAKGEYIVTLDADLQDKPSEIKKILDALEDPNGAEVVCGWRKNRQDSFKKKLSSKFFNSLANRFWGLKLHDYNCGLKGYTAQAAKSLKLYGGFHRFIPLLAYQHGFTVMEVPVEHAKRKFGVSKYGFSKLWKDMPDMLTMIFLSRYKERPLHFFGIVGEILFLLGILVLGYLSFLHFAGETIGTRPLLFLGVMLVLSGIQAFFTGFLADLLVHLNDRQENGEKFLGRLKYSSEE